MRHVLQALNDLATMRGRRSHAVRTLALVLAMLTCPLMAEAQPLRDSREAAEAFRGEIELFLRALPLERERFMVRINRCQNPAGGMRDDVYAVWIGARLIAPEDNAAAVLALVRDKWAELDWTVFRDRLMDNGGVNLAARDPHSGSTYSLDSGLRAGPSRYVVGYFATVCFADPGNDVTFGTVRED